MSKNNGWAKNERTSELQIKCFAQLAEIYIPKQRADSIAVEFNYWIAEASKP